MRKVLLFIAAGCLIAGVILFVCVGASVDFDFMKFTSMKFVTNTHEIQKSFDSISVDTITADIEFRLAEDGNCRVVCREKEKLTHSVDVEDGVLVISATDERNLLDHIKGSIFSFGTPSVTIYLPEKHYRSLKVENTTGDVMLCGNWSFDDLELVTTTGDVKVMDVFCRKDVSVCVTTGKAHLDNLNCKNLTVKGCTGDAVLKNVIVADTMRVKCTSGDIKLDRCDAGTLYLHATTGDVTGTLLTPKVFSASATTGDVDVPDSSSGGRCEISVTTGDICVKIR